MRFASVEGVELTSAEMDLRADFPNDLKYDLEGASGSGMEQLRYTLKLTSPAPREDVLRIVRRAEANCHAAESLKNPVPVYPTLDLNGEEIALG